MRDVPDGVHRRLKARAAEEGRTLSELIRSELIEIASRPTLSEVVERIRAREAVSIREESADAIRNERAGR